MGSAVRFPASHLWDAEATSILADGGGTRRCDGPRGWARWRNAGLGAVPKADRRRPAGAWAAWTDEPDFWGPGPEAAQALADALVVIVVASDHAGLTPDRPPLRVERGALSAGMREQEQEHGTA